MEILDTWVEDGFITAEQRESIASLIQDKVDASYDAGYDAGYYSNGDYDAGFDAGFDQGYAECQAGFESKRDEWFMQGWEEALVEHGIEE